MLERNYNEDIDGKIPIKSARLDRQSVKVSDLSLEALYNPEIDEIKHFEYYAKRNALPINMYFIEDFRIKQPPKNARNAEKINLEEG